MSTKTAPMSSDTARGLRYWLQVNNLDHQETVPLTVLDDAIEQAETRQSRLKRNILTGAFAVAALVHLCVLSDLYNHHCGSSYPAVPKTHGVYSLFVAFVVSVLAIAGFAGSLLDYVPLSRKCITSTIASAIITNTVIVVTLFVVQESAGHAYQGQGRTLTIYNLVISSLLFLVGCVVGAYRLGLLRGSKAEGRIILD